MLDVPSFDRIWLKKNKETGRLTIIFHLSIETESFASLRGHSTVMEGLNAYVDWKKKRCNISLSYQKAASRGVPFLAVLSASSLGTSLLGDCLKIILRRTGFVPPQAQTVGPF